MAISTDQNTEDLGYTGIVKHAVYEYPKHGVNTTKDIKKSGNWNNLILDQTYSVIILIYWGYIKSRTC